MIVFYRSNKQSEAEAEADLFAIITQRQRERKDRLHSMFSSLASKYGGDNAASEPTEEEFEAVQMKLESRRKASKKSKWT